VKIFTQKCNFSFQKKVQNKKLLFQKKGKPPPPPLECPALLEWPFKDRNGGDGRTDKLQSSIQN